MPKKIKQYEHKTLSFSTEDFDSTEVTKELNVEGDKGWELVSVNTITGWHETSDPDNSCRSYIYKNTEVLFFLRREKA